MMPRFQNRTPFRGTQRERANKKKEKKMTQSPATDSPSRVRLWTGRIVSAVPILFLIMSAVMKLSRRPEVVEGFAKFGFPANSLVPIGLVEILCVVLYLVPWTSVLGAVLLTGYLGGAVVTHVRVGDNFLAPLGMGVLLWLGLYLRVPRLGALLPLRLQPRI